MLFARSVCRFTVAWTCCSRYGQSVVLEVNTIPGMTEASLLPEAAAVAGITMWNFARASSSFLAPEREEPQMRRAQRRPRSRNRRVSNMRQRRQQHLLDVKVRSRKAATASQPPGRCVFLSKLGLLVAALCAAFYFGTRRRERFFFENPGLYRSSKIESRPTARLQREQILKRRRSARRRKYFSRQSRSAFTIACSSCRRSTRCRWCGNCLAKSISGSSSASRSRGSRARNKSPIHLRSDRLFWWTRAAF